MGNMVTFFEINGQVETRTEPSALPKAAAIIGSIKIDAAEEEWKKIKKTLMGYFERRGIHSSYLNSEAATSLVRGFDMAWRF